MTHTMVIVVRLVLGIVLGTLFGIGGYIVGWYIAFSVPTGVPRIPFLVILAGLGAGLGSFLGWWIDLDGGSNRNRYLIAFTVILAIVAAIGGAWGGYLYGETIEGTRVWRHPTTQAILNGTVIASNITLLVWNIGLRIVWRSSEQHAPAASYIQSLRKAQTSSKSSERDELTMRE